VRGRPLDFVRPLADPLEESPRAGTRGAQWMASLADERAAAARLPALVDGRVRAAVAFLADDPKNGPARGGEQAPRPLDGRGVDSVLRVAEPDPGLLAGGNDLVAGCQGAAEHLGPRGCGRGEAARERLLDDHVLAGPGRFDGEGRVERRRHAEVDHVHVARGEHLLGAGRDRADAELLGEPRGPLRPHCRDPRERHVHTADLMIGLSVQPRGESGADETNPDCRAFDRHRPSLAALPRLVNLGSASVTRRSLGETQGIGAGLGKSFQR